MHAWQSGYRHIPPQDYFACEICPKDNQGCGVVQAALKDHVDLGWIQHTWVREINMVQGCPGEYKVYIVEDLEGSVVRFHKTLNGLPYFRSDFHAYSRCGNSRRYLRGWNDIQKLMDDRTIPVLRDREKDEVLAITPQINGLEPMEIQYNSGKTIVTPLVIYLPVSIT